MNKIERLELEVTEAIDIISKLKPEDVIIKMLKTTGNGANYHSFAFMINNKPSTISIKFHKENVKLKPQTNGQFGLSKVKFSLKLENSDLGQFLVLFDELLQSAIRIKFKANLYPNIRGFVQKTISKTDEEGVEQCVPIDHPLGWINMPHCFKSNDKAIYGGIIVLIDGNTTNKLTKPSFATIQEIWASRAIVTGSIVLEHMLIMKTKDIYLKCSINCFKQLTVKPTAYDNQIDENDIEEMITHSEANGINRDADFD